jgi:hypothetical protein
MTPRTKGKKQERLGKEEADAAREWTLGENPIAEAWAQCALSPEIDSILKEKKETHAAHLASITIKQELDSEYAFCQVLITCLPSHHVD